MTVVADAVSILSELARSVVDATHTVADTTGSLPLAAALLGTVSTVALARGVSKRRERVRRDREEGRRLQAVLAAAVEPERVKEKPRSVMHPSDFVDALARAGEAGSDATPVEVARSWLDELGPALEKAYVALATERLVHADSAEDVAEARRLAAGAQAASPNSPAARRLIEVADEALDRRIFDTLSEAGRIAWRIGRLTLRRRPQANGLSDIIGQGLYRIGGALRLSGWEPEEMRAEALSLIGFSDVQEEREEQVAETGPRRVTAARPSLPASRHERPQLVLMPSPSRKTQQRESAGQRPEVEEQGSRRFRVVDREPARAETSLRAFRLRANTAYELGRQGRHAEAESAFRQLWQEMRRVESIGESHPDTLTVRHNRAQMLMRMGRYMAAEDEFQAIYVMHRRGLRSLPDDLLRAVRFGLAAAAEAQGRFREAEAIYRELLSDCAKGGAEAAESPIALWTRMRMLLAQETVAARA